MSAPGRIETAELQAWKTGADITWSRYYRSHMSDLEIRFPKLCRFDPDFNYAGPAGCKALDRAVPDAIFWVSIRYAAFMHDRLYQVGGSEHDRYMADLLFYHIIADILERSYLTWRYTPTCLIRWAMKLAETYYHAVHMGGKLSFNHH